MFRTLTFSLITLVLTITDLDAQLPYYCNWAQETGSTGFEKSVGIATDSSDNIYNIGVFRSAFDADYGPGVTILTPYNDGNDDLFITKHSRDGALSWAFKLGDSNKDFAKTIVLDSAANFYLTGGFSSYLDCDPGPANYWLTAYNYGIFIAKYDSLAHIKWAKSISGGQVEMGRDLALDHSCNIYVTGSFGTPSNNTPGYMVDFDPDTGVSTLTCNGATDIFVCKFDSSGHFLWADQIGGTGIDFGYNIVADDSGNCYILGDFFGTVDFDPDTAVVYNLTSSGNSRFVLKLDKNGHFQWAFKITTGSSLDPDSYGHRILVNGAGEIYLPLGISGTADLNPLGNPYVVTVSQAEYLLKYSTNGQLIYADLLCQSLPSFAVTSIKQLGSDKLLFTGTAVGAADLDPGPGSMIVPWLGYEDCYFSVFDTAGAFVTGKWAGSTTHDGYLDIAPGHHGNIFACGYHGDTNGGGGGMDFGDSLSVFNYNYAGWYDCTLAKYSLQPSTFIHPSILRRRPLLLLH